MTSPAFGDYQLEIYGAGLRGVVPTFPMALAELEARAARRCRRRCCPTGRRPESGPKQRASGASWSRSTRG